MLSSIIHLYDLLEVRWLLFFFFPEMFFFYPFISTWLIRSHIRGGSRHDPDSILIWRKLILFYLSSGCFSRWHEANSWYYLFPLRRLVQIVFILVRGDCSPAVEKNRLGIRFYSLNIPPWGAPGMKNTVSVQRWQQPTRSHLTKTYFSRRPQWTQSWIVKELSGA